MSLSQEVEAVETLWLLLIYVNAIAVAFLLPIRWWPGWLARALGVAGCVAWLVARADVTGDDLDAVSGVVMLVALPWAAFAFLASLNRLTVWLLDREAERATVQYGPDHKQTRTRSPLRKMARHSYQRWIGPL